MPISVAGSNANDHGFTSVRRSAEHGFTLVGRSAEHGFTLVRRSAEHGFTLVELMVVIAVLAVASAAVVLAMPDPRGRVRDAADRLAARARAAQEAAIVRSHPVGLWITPAGYGFEERLKNGWQPIGDKSFRVTEWPGGVAALTRRRERIVYDPTGLADRDLAVVLARGGVETEVALGTDGSVRVNAP